MLCGRVCFQWVALHFLVINLARGLEPGEFSPGMSTGGWDGGGEGSVAASSVFVGGGETIVSVQLIESGQNRFVLLIGSPVLRTSASSQRSAPTPSKDCDRSIDQ